MLIGATSQGGKIMAKRKAIPRLNQAKKSGWRQKKKPGPIIMATPPELPKMSDLLWDFVLPFTGDLPENRLRRLLDIAVNAWNVGLLPPEKREKVLLQTE